MDSRFDCESVTDIICFTPDALHNSININILSYTHTIDSPHPRSFQSA